MTSFASNQGPFLSGLRPKTFFAERKKMLDYASKHKSTGLKYFPAWNKNKESNKDNKERVDYSYRAFLESLPWTLALAQLFYIIIF